MTPQSQRRAIAEACGWREIRDDDPTMFNVWGKRDAGWDRVPNYLNDLNAMHEAEKALFGKVGWVHYSHVLLFDNIHATAAQRAEAFLRTIGKWTDSTSTQPNTPSEHLAEGKTV